MNDFSLVGFVYLESIPCLVWRPVCTCRAPDWRSGHLDTLLPLIRQGPFQHILFARLAVGNVSCCCSRLPSGLDVHSTFTWGMYTLSTSPFSSGRTWRGGWAVEPVRRICLVALDYTICLIYLGLTWRLLHGENRNGSGSRLCVQHVIQPLVHT